MKTMHVCVCVHLRASFLAYAFFCNKSGHQEEKKEEGEEEEEEEEEVRLVWQECVLAVFPSSLHTLVFAVAASRHCSRQPPHSPSPGGGGSEKHTFRYLKSVACHCSVPRGSGGPN